MWYALQVYTGKEEEIILLCEKYLEKSVYRQCFCPKYEMSYKKKGIRTLVTQVLFPGYIFLDTEKIEQVHTQLKEIPEFIKILKMQEEYIPITKEEQAFIQKHGNADYIFEISRGYVQGDQVVITEGAFEGYKGRLTHVDRHNRYGVIEVEMFGRKVQMKFGLEIVKKIV